MAKKHQHTRRLSFLAQVEVLEPRWLLSTASGGDTPALMSGGEGEGEAPTFSEPGATIGLPGNTSMNNPTYGSTFRSALNGGVGYWDNPSSWVAGRVPNATDKVIIAGGDTLIIRDTAAIAQAVGVYEGGKLQFATNVNTELKAVTVVVLGEFEMGTQAAPIDAAVTAKLTIRNVAIDTTADPGQWGNGLVVLGKIRVHGAVKDVSENRLTVQPRVGQNTLTFAHDVTGWRVGDALFVPGTKQLTEDEYNAGASQGFESMTIASIAGNVVTLTAALTVDHLGATNSLGVVEFMPVVQNLTRNAYIKSENMTATRGHALFAGRADVDIRYARFGGLGRSQIGDLSNFRVPVHFYHLIGPATPQANGYQYTFIGNSITCPLDPMPFMWGLLINDSHFGLIQNNDLNNWAGAGIVALTGSETQNVLDGNRVMRINGTGNRTDDTAEAGAGFWLRGPDNYVRNNIAANIKGGIYSYGFNAAYERYLGTVTIPNFQGADSSQTGQGTSVDMNSRSLREFRNNEVFGSQNGMTLWWLGAFFETPADSESVIKDFKAWNVYGWGMYLYESNRLTIDGFRYLVSDNGYYPHIAITAGDYMNRRLVIQNARIENGDIELATHTDVRDTADSDATVGRVTIKDSTIIGPRSRIFGSAPYSVNSSVGLAKRVVLLINDQFINTDMPLLLHTTDDATRAIPQNYIIVQNYNSPPGVNGEDFLVYPDYKTGPGTQQPNRSEIGGKIYNLVDSTAPTLSNIAVSGITSSSANISATSSEASAFQIQYGTTTAYGESATHAGFATSRSLSLGRLLAGTTYNYRVLSWDAYGNLTTSANGTFTTSGAAADTTPPVISGVATSNLTATGATIAWTTNETSDTQVEYGTTISYGSTSPLNTAMVTSHSAGITGLAANTTYHYRVRSRDAAGNLATSADFTFTTAADTTAPVISGVTSSNLTATGATIAWTTNEPSDTQVEYGTTPSYGSTSPLNTAMVTSHSAGITGLAANTTYHYRVRSRDAAGNLATSADFTFTTAADTTAPVISGVASSNLTATGATIAWTTNEASDTQVEYGTTTSYGSTSPLNTAMVTSHSAGITGLAASTTYHYRVRSRDAAGNLATSADFTFTTAADTTAPVISGVASSNLTATGATIAWTTNEASDTQVEYGTTTSYGSTSPLNTSMVTSHSAGITGLAASTTYHYRVRSRDSAGNLALSADQTLTTTSAGTIYSYNNPPPLPPSSPASTVNVSSVGALINAINNLQSGQTISIAPGTYDLTGLVPSLHIPENLNNWTIRGATGNRADVVIKGAGMSGSVMYGFWIGVSMGGTIADLTIDGVKDHGIIANPGANNLLVHNVRIVDSGDQFVKSNPDASGVGNTGGVVEYSVFEYRTTDNNNYTNGVDVVGGDGWIVRYNLFQNFLSPAGQGLAGPAILMWKDVRNSIIEGNTFINCARGISLGLVDQPTGFDHQGGVIRNNFFYRDASLPQEVDVPIYVADSPNTKVYHNTIIAQGSYPNSIEYRFASTTGTDIKNNLTDGIIRARDGATATLGGNITNASLSMFVNPAAGDLHLASSASPINQGVAIAGLTNDIDGQSRDSQLDVGADEVIAGSAPDSTAPTITGVGTSNVTGASATIAWTTNEAADTQVEYGTSTSYGSTTTLNTSPVTSHSVGLSGLSPSTTYHFRVRSRDAAGNLAVSGDFVFTTSTNLVLSNQSVSENSPNDKVVGTLAANDGNSAPHTFTLVNGAGGRFKIVGDQLQVASGTLLNYEAAASHGIVVEVTSAGGPTYQSSLTINVTNVNEITGFDVQKGLSERSFVRYVDLIFESTAALDSLLSGNRLRLMRYGLDGVSNPVQVSLAGAVSRVDNSLAFNFGAQGIGGNRNSNVGDGYYRLSVDQDGDGVYEAVRSFYRLFGDVNGDKKVDNGDVALVQSAYGQSGSNLNNDVNGDGVVNSTDRNYARNMRGRKLATGLNVDD